VKHITLLSYLVQLVALTYYVQKKYKKMKQRSTKPGINIVKAHTICIMVSNSSLKLSYNLIHSYIPKRFKFTTCKPNSVKQIAAEAGGISRTL